PGPGPVRGRAAVPGTPRPVRPPEGHTSGIPQRAPQAPVHCGGRFSMNAMAPSLAISAGVSAFLASGRFRRTTRLGPRRSSTSSGDMTVLRALGELGGVPHEVKHYRAERLELEVVSGPLEALLEDD